MINNISIMKSHLKRWLSFSPFQVYESIRKPIRFASDAKRIRGIVESGLSDRLHIGCGGNIIEGWINSDIVKEKTGALFLNATGPFPIPDALIRYTYSEHVFEHLDLEGQVNYLRESFRVLSPGGKIRIATPEFSRILSLMRPSDLAFAKEYVDANYKTFINGKWPFSDKVNQRIEYVINNYMRDWGHQMIHSWESLSELVTLAGFTGITSHEVGESTDPNLCSLEKHYEMIGVKYNRFETQILEAFKPL